MTDTDTAELPDDSKVICPNCVHQFTAICVDDQRHRREQADELEALREEARLFGEIMAVIHRDGGHYRAEHGNQKAFEDAVAKHYERQSENEALRASLKQYAPVAQALVAEVVVLRAENERLRAALEDVEIAGPDADGLVWLQSRRGFMFNLGRAESLATANAVHWDEMRRAALERLDGK